MSGCASKTIRKGIPFDLDKVFEGQVGVKEEHWKEKGVRLAKDKDFDQAIQAFKKYVEEEPENWSGFNGIAVCYKNLGDHSNAMKNFERALELALSPEDRAKILANIGNMYLSADKPQVALGYYKEAASESDGNPIYLVSIARTFLTLNETDRARKALAAAERLAKNFERFESDDDKGAGSYWTAYCYAGLNMEDKVFQYLEQAIKANPDVFQTRLEKECSDPKSLFFSLKDDPRLKKIFARYAVKAS